MLKNGGGLNAKPDISRAVTDLLKEDSNFDRSENRSAHRENLVRPVNVELRDEGKVVPAFSRNISATGIGIITDEPVQIDGVAVLHIQRIQGKEVVILAECRWCKAYGENWYISGWQFINLKR